MSSDQTTVVAASPFRVLWYPPPHGLRPSRLRALLEVARKPGWELQERESSRWQLYRRGLVDRDGFGWRLTVAGQSIACMEGVDG